MATTTTTGHHLRLHKEQRQAISFTTDTLCFCVPSCLLPSQRENLVRKKSLSRKKSIVKRTYVEEGISRYKYINVLLSFKQVITTKSSIMRKLRYEEEWTELWTRKENERNLKELKSWSEIAAKTKRHHKKQNKKKKDKLRKNETEGKDMNENLHESPPRLISSYFFSWILGIEQQRPPSPNFRQNIYPLISFFTWRGSHVSCSSSHGLKIDFANLEPKTAMTVDWFTTKGIIEAESFQSKTTHDKKEQNIIMHRRVWVPFITRQITYKEESI